MTRRERLEHKLELRQEWAGKAAARADRRFGAAHKLADGIPLGQPILVGHHSAPHARRDAERIDSNMHKAVEESALAHHHISRASGLALQLEHSIFSDDANAIAALQARVAAREQEAERYAALNKAWRRSKGDVTDFAQIAGLTDGAAQTIAKVIADAYSWEKQPIPSWQLTNLRANIRRDHERIAEIKNRSAKAEYEASR